MRISDWSSDVCSSDLAHSAAELPPAEQPDLAKQGWRRMHPDGLTGYDALLPVLLVRPGDPGRAEARVETGSHSLNVLGGFHGGYLASIGELALFLPLFLHGKVSSQRSEEHTSELQSLMRISYAVFCLKKKKKTHNNNNTQ